MLALIKPVITLEHGRWVAMIKSLPLALARVSVACLSDLILIVSYDTINK